MKHTQAEIAAVYGDGLRKNGRELVGACPLCGGDDRFRIMPDGGMYCRQCLPDGNDPEQFKAMLKALGIEPNGKGRKTDPPDWKRERQRLADLVQNRTDATDWVIAATDYLTAGNDPAPDEELDRILTRLEAGEDVDGMTCGKCGQRPAWRGGDLIPCGCDAPLLLTWDQYKAAAMEQPNGDYIVPKLYRRGQCSLLVGEPKAGKSTLCRRLAVAVAKGGRVLGYEAAPAPVVYMPLQEDMQHVVREVEAVNPDDPNPGVRFYLNNPAAPMEWDRLAEAVREIGAGLVVVDMVSDFRAWEDESNYAEMKAVIGAFKGLARDTNAHVLLVHHGKKSPSANYPTARVLGSQAIAGEVDVVASIHRQKDKRIFEAHGRGMGDFRRVL